MTIANCRVVIGRHDGAVLVASENLSLRRKVPVSLLVLSPTHGSLHIGRFA
jgi:hypothetical protein